jgi:hypothetical protein
MDIRIDFSEVTAFAAAMAAAPGRLADEMETANAALLVEGVGLAQEFAPVLDGTLRGSIAIIDGPDASGGSYGSSLEYAWQREEGGTILPRNGRYLVFEIDGETIFATSVTQDGSHYMQQSADALEPLVLPAYEKAVDRVMESL